MAANDGKLGQLLAQFAGVPPEVAARMDRMIYDAGTDGDADALNATELSSVRSMASKDWNFDPAAAGHLTAVGTYTGTGAALSVSIGWRPDLVIVKSEGASPAGFAAGEKFWFGRTFVPIGEAMHNGGVTPNETGFDVGTDAYFNTASSTYHYIAIKDNGSGGLALGDYAGNGIAGRTMSLFKGRPLVAAIMKRDNVQMATALARGLTGYFYDGTAISGGTINADGTMTLGSGTDVNYWTGNAGESCAVAGFCDGLGWATTYVGDGTASRLIPFPWEPDAVMVLARGATSRPATLWISSLAAGEHLDFAATAKGTGRISSVSGARMLVSNNANVNATGVTYLVIAIRRSRSGFALPGKYPLHRSLKSQKLVWLPGGVASAYIDCGTHDSLNVVGPQTLEWFGVHLNTNLAPMTGGSSVNDEAKQLPLIWRQSGADGAASTGVNWGMMICPPTAGGTAGNSFGPGVYVAVTNRFNLPQDASSYDLDANQPWQTGVPIPPRQPAHIVATHDGFGYWNVYLNGSLVKERVRDLTSVGLPNTASVPGARTIINGRYRTSVAHSGQYHAFHSARVYSRALSASEVLQNFKSLFAGGPDPVSDFVEQWRAQDASGSTVPATVNPANNGTIVGGSVLGI